VLHFSADVATATSALVKFAADATRSEIIALVIALEKEKENAIVGSIDGYAGRPDARK
jgi:hypothetical protein